MEYQPKTAPYAHQLEAFERGHRRFSFGWLMDPGTGKSKVAIDNAAFLYEKSIIQGLLILAPNDVDRQWLEEQLPLHMPERIGLRPALWEASSARATRAVAQLTDAPIAGRLALLAMNHEAMATARGVAAATKFLRRYASMLVVDESHGFKTPKAMRTRALQRLAPLAKVRRILTGTPTTQSPFDLYSQFRFLDPRILGFDSFLAFKHHYGIWQKEHVKRRDKRTGELQTVQYESLQSYQRLEELYARIEPHSFRKRKEDCLDLPPKIYGAIPTHLSPAQRALYEQIKEHGFALLAQGKELKLRAIDELEEDEVLETLQQAAGRVSTKIKLTIMLRLRQITGGFITDDAGQSRCIDGSPERCPRIQALLAKVELVEGKAIIWAQFRAELTALHALLAARHGPAACALVHGGIKAGRSEIFDRFKDPRSPLRFLIAHERTAGIGQNFQVARSVFYYTSGFSYAQRVQSEDRAHRAGQAGAVNIWDLRARDAPIDALIAEAFGQRKALADLFMGWSAEELQKRC